MINYYSNTNNASHVKWRNQKELMHPHAWITTARLREELISNQWASRALSHNTDASIMYIISLSVTLVVGTSRNWLAITRWANHNKTVKQQMARLICTSEVLARVRQLTNRALLASRSITHSSLEIKWNVSRRYKFIQIRKGVCLSQPTYTCR